MRTVFCFFYSYLYCVSENLREQFSAALTASADFSFGIKQSADTLHCVEDIDGKDFVPKNSNTMCRYAPQ